ncbi:MAG: hypothetical protein Q4C06_05625 [Bacillota bacterium]|nr:hypothetical protein [Bacillota bacterium]
MKGKLLAVGMALSMLFMAGCGGGAQAETDENTAPAAQETDAEAETSSAAEQETEDTKEKVPAWVTADYAENVISAYPSYDVFIADESEDHTEIAFIAEGNVQDFRFLGLNVEDVLEDGTLLFTTEALYHAEVFSPEKPLVVKMTFWGTMPTYGISYVNEKGETKNFTVEMSGMDGSVYLGEF